MSRKLTYKNSLGGELQMDGSAPYILQDFIESGSVNIYNSKGMKQDGETYIGNTLDVRDIYIKAAVIGSSPEEIAIHRKKFYEIFNPKLNEGYLIYEDGSRKRKIKCIVNKLPYFNSTSPTLETCLVNLTANNPFWTDINESKKEIAAWLGSFEFQLEIPLMGMEFGYRVPSLIVNVNNTGDVECGLGLEFRALATVENPSLYNVNTREYLMINKTMAAGETISVQTAFGNKKVESKIHGAKINAINYLDLGSTFLKLATGDNLFRYNAKSGIDNLEVSIYYTPQYLGV